MSFHLVWCQYPAIVPLLLESCWCAFHIEFLSNSRSILSAFCEFHHIISDIFSYSFSCSKTWSCLLMLIFSSFCDLFFEFLCLLLFCRRKILIRFMLVNLLLQLRITFSFFSLVLHTGHLGRHERWRTFTYPRITH